MELDHNRGQLNRAIPTILFSFAIILGVTGFVLFYLNRDTTVPASWAAAGGTRNGLVNWLNAIFQTLVLPLVAATFGTLIARQRPRHPIGWLLLTIGLSTATSTTLSEWAIYGYYTVAVAMPNSIYMGWFVNWLWVFLVSIVLLMVAIFPNGAFVSRRWRTIILMPLSLFALPIFIASAVETPMSSAAQIVNPFVNTFVPWYEPLFNFGIPFLPLTAVVILAAVVVRFRRSRGQERLQIKWLLGGMASMAVMVVIGLELNSLGIVIGDVLVNVASLAPLTGIGVALVRHQLYDIDVIIRRTVQYSIVSVLLAAVYLGSITLIQGAITAVTQTQSPLAIVLSTLLIAALFNPLRQRVQAFIDRRFYRQKYDAQQVLAQFAQTARDEVEINELTVELLDVIQKTMQPQNLSIWLKE